MSGVVHFKFGHAHGFDRLNFEGHFISVGDLKRLITEKRQLGSGPAGALALADPETGVEYGDDGHLLRRNAAVIVKRVPLRAPGSAAVIESAPAPEEADAAPVGGGGPAVVEAARNAEEEFGGDLFAGGDPEGGGAAGGEACDGDGDDLAALVAHTADTWAREVAAGRGRGRGRPMGNDNFVGRGSGRGERDPGVAPPPGYVCHRCHQSGHWIKDCPTNGDPAFDVMRARAPVGIPLERLAQVEQGGLVLPDGSVGVAMADDKTFEQEAAVIRAAQADTVPADLACGLCERLVKDAVTIQCCETSFCDACVRKVVMATGTCPSCHKVGVLCDDLEPDEDLRKAVREHLAGVIRAQPAAAVPRLPAAPPSDELPKTEDTAAAENNVVKPESETVRAASPINEAVAAGGGAIQGGAGPAPPLIIAPVGVTAPPPAGGPAPAQTANLVAQAAAIAQAQLAQQMVAQRAMQAPVVQVPAEVAVTVPAPQAPSLLKALRGETQPTASLAPGCAPLSPMGGPGGGSTAPQGGAIPLPSPPKLPAATDRLAVLTEEARACLPGAAPELLAAAFLPLSDFPVSEMEFNRLQAQHRAAKPKTAAQIEAKRRKRGREREREREKKRQMSAVDVNLQRQRQLAQQQIREQERQRERQRQRGRGRVRDRDRDRERDRDRGRRRERDDRSWDMDRDRGRDLRHEREERDRDRKRQRGFSPDGDRARRGGRAVVFSRLG